VERERLNCADCLEERVVQFVLRRNELGNSKKASRFLAISTRLHRLVRHFHLAENVGTDFVQLFARPPQFRERLRFADWFAGSHARLELVQLD
jgi:hypothetical protein